LFYALATYGFAGVMREQVCKYMCPYARFQSAMFDRNTLIISYDAKRGEPRGARKKGSLSSVLERPRGLIEETLANDYVIANAKTKHTGDAAISTGLIVDHSDHNLIDIKVSELEQLGDCIDCTICVQVCPTGIDIRNGLQYECIACGACIDACDEVMDKLGYPKGLVRYTTHNALVGHKVNFFRPRIIIYATLLVALLAGTIFGIALRKPLIVDVIRDQQLYRITEDNAIENAFTLRLVNKTNKAQSFSVTLQNSADITLIDSPIRISAMPEQVLTLPITLRSPTGAVKGKRDIQFEIATQGSDNKVIEESRFFGPIP
jgi:polyferredoxin